jgi:hypothetical protein
MFDCPQARWSAADPTLQLTVLKQSSHRIVTPLSDFFPAPKISERQDHPATFNKHCAHDDLSKRSLTSNTQR